MKIANVGLVGCGRVGDHYVKILKSKKIKNYKIKAVCDHDLKKAKLFSKYFKSNYFSDYKDKNFYKKINTVLILTPSGSHFEIAKFFLKKKIHVVCEKPLTMIPKNSILLDKLAKKNKVLCTVVFQNRFNKSIKYLKKNIENKKFGKIVSVSLSLLWCRYQKYYNDGWHGTWLNDGGVTNQQAIHHLDIIRWIFGPITYVCSVSENRVNKLEAEDTMHAIFKFNSGCNGSIELTTAARPNDLHASISVVGDKGTIVISGLGLNKIQTLKLNINKKKISKLKKEFSEKVSSGYGNSHIFYLNEIFERIAKKRNLPLVSGVEAYETSKLIHAIYKSSENNRWIKVNNKNLSKKLGKNN